MSAPRNPSPPNESTREPAAASGVVHQRGVYALTATRANPDREAEWKPLDLNLIRRLIGYMSPYAAKRNWLLLCSVLRAIQIPMFAWLVGAVINGPIAQHAPWPDVLAGSLGLFAWAAFTQITFHFRYRLALELGERVVHDLHNDLFRQLQRLPMSFYHTTKIGRIISRMTSDCEALRVGVQEVLFVTLIGGGQMVVSGLMMLWYDWVLFAVVAGMTPLVWLLNQFFRQRLSQAYRDVQESFSRVTSTLAESVNGIRVTQGFVREELNAQLFGELVEDHAQFNMRAARTSGVFMPLLELSSQVFIAALLVIGGYRVLSPQVDMPAGDLIRFFFLANVFFGPIQFLGTQYNQALTAMAGAERVFRLLDLKPAWSDPPDARELPRLTGRVEFKHLTFGYDPSKPVLHDISFVAQPGQTVALVGHTGSGKTTIVNLIARFYLPDAGELWLDDVETRAIHSPSLHRQLGLVLQQNFLFTGSVLENIRLGKPSASDAEVREALARLDCLELLDALPEGLNTEVGERGSKLSLGQRQLTCFARAMLADPRILILDEATSSVDTLTEARIQRALAKLLSGRTALVIAHRLSTIRHADLVLVLDGGRIVERGQHDELLAQGGHYAGLVRQFQRGMGI